MAYAAGDIRQHNKYYCHACTSEIDYSLPVSDVICRGLLSMQQYLPDG